jgi:hypothetical protein
MKAPFVVPTSIVTPSWLIAIALPSLPDWSLSKQEIATRKMGANRQFALRKFSYILFTATHERNAINRVSREDKQCDR